MGLHPNHLRLEDLENLAIEALPLIEWRLSSVIVLYTLRVPTKICAIIVGQNLSLIAPPGEGEMDTSRPATRLDRRSI